MARLIVKHRGELRREIEIEPNMLIGRDANARVLIGEPASRQHARIEQDNEGYLLRDLDSKSGTLLDGQAITSVRLTDGMELTIGEYALVFRDPAAPQTEGRDSFLNVITTLDAATPPFQHWIDAKRITAKAERLRAHLQTVHDIGRAIAARHDTDSVLAEVVERLSEVFPGAHRGFLALRDEPGGELTIRVLKSDGDRPPTEMLSRTIAHRAMDTRQAILCSDARAEFRGAASVQDLALGSVLCVPLLLPDRVMGILQWDACGAIDAFSEDDLNLLSGIASLLAAALENARLYDELRAAKARTDVENARLRVAARVTAPMAAMVGSCDGLAQARGLAEQMAAVDTSVLITGETGTGKELLARAIHGMSRRSDRPFVAVNCAAVPEGLLEAELFGVGAGAATGVAARVGRIEQSHGGTLFLDEVGDMSPAMQAKVLRALEEKTIEKVGGAEPIHVDTRIIAATHRDLPAAIEAGEFREDLYYRLRVVEIRLPPLRERGSDVIALAHHFLASFSADMAKSLPGFTPEVEDKLTAHAWPGNIRELRNAIERASALAQNGETIDVDLLPGEVAGEDADLIARHKQRGRMDSAVASLEIEMIRTALAETHGNRTQAAERLGISREGLRLKIIRYGIAT